MTENKIPTETFDIMQHYYRTVHEPLIHCALYLDGHADLNALARAAAALAEQIPVLGCRFDESALRWVPGNFTAGDFVETADGEAEDALNRALTLPVAIAEEPQLKIVAVRFAENDVLCLRINHMVCDGAGFKQCLYRLAGLYAGLPQEPVPSDRSMRPLFAGMRFAEKLSLLFLKPETQKKLGVLSPPFTGDEHHPFIVTREVDKAAFTSVREAAKKYGATVNDMILSAYIRTLSAETGQREIDIPCPVDLRKFCRGSREPGIGNLTGNYSCRVVSEKGEPFSETLHKVSARMRRQKESRYCLKSPFELSLLARLLSKRRLRALFPKLFTVPIVAYTNLGVVDFPEECRKHITGCFLTGAVKHVPYFQIAVSTFDGVCTLSCNLHGTPQDREKTGRFLDAVALELTCGGT